MTAAVYLNGATVMTTPTQRVLKIARATGYAGIEARGERLLADPAEVRATAEAARPNDVLTVNGVALTVRADGRVDRQRVDADLGPRLRICADLGSPYLLAIPPRAPGLSTRKAIPGTRDALELARDRADAMGIVRSTRRRSPPRPSTGSTRSISSSIPVTGMPAAAYRWTVIR